MLITRRKAKIHDKALHSKAQMENFMDCLTMVKMAFVFMPYPQMIGAGVRLDFEGILNMVHKTNEIMQKGLIPEEETRVAINEDEILSRSVIKKHIRHYPTMPSRKFQVTDLFQATNMRPTVAFAYGNVVEVVIENASLDEVSKRLRYLEDFDVHFKTEFFKETTGDKLFKLYLGEKFLSEKRLSSGYVSPIMTVFFVVIVLDTAEQVNETARVIKSLGFELREKIPGHVWIGQSPSTNFISAPFFGITISPVVLMPPTESDHKYDDFLDGLFNSIIAIGEFYNIVETINDAHELCVIASYSIPLELSQNIGTTKINPLHMRDIYGLRSFNKYERLFHSFYFQDVKHIRLYGSKAAEIIQKQEGVFHFPVISGLLSLIEAYSRYAPDVIYENDQSQEKDMDREFRTSIFRIFEDRLDSLKDTLEKFVEDIQGVIEAARTAVQLNLAIVTLIWTLFFTVIFAIFPIQEWLETLLVFLQSLLNQTNFPNFPLRPI